MSFTVQKTQRNRIKKFVYLILGLYIIMGISLSFFQEKLLFLPTVLEQDHKFKFSQPFEELFLKAKDGSQLNALHFKVENSKGVILYFHGNAGDLQRWGEITRHFTRFNYDVLVMDYRSFGKSTGAISETALYEDAQLFYNYVSNIYSGDDIIIYGRSLGTGIATKIASENEIKHLILETPYTSITDIAKHRFPIFPVKLLLKYKMPTYQFIRNVDSPITIFHGTEDKVVPYKFGKQLYDLNLPKMDFITIEGGKHNDLVEYDLYQEHIFKLLK